MKAIDEMTLKDTYEWSSDCPPWCDGHIASFEEDLTHSMISSLMTPTKDGYVLARRYVRQLIPGVDYRHVVTGPLGYLRIEMNNTETLAAFEKRAETLLDQYEVEVEKWCQVMKKVTSE